MLASIGSQGFSSLTNFLVSLFLARELSKYEYGLYSILFRTLIILSAVQNAFILSPLSILYHEKNNGQALVFSSFTFQNTVLFFITIIGIPVFLFFNTNPEHIMIGLLFAILFFTYILREYFRTLHYCEFKINNLLAKESLGFIMVLSSLLLFSRFSNWTINKALLVLILYNITFLLQCKAYKKLFFRIGVQFGHISAMFRLGKWSFIGTISSVLTSNAYVYIIGYIASLTTVAEFNLSRTLWMPIGLLVASIQRYSRSKGKKILEDEGIKKLFAFQFGKTVVILFVYIFFFIIIYVSNSYLIPFLFKNQYNNIGTKLVFWGIYFGIGIIRSPFTNTLLILKLNKQTAIAAVNGMIAALLFLIYAVVIKNSSLVFLALFICEITMLLTSVFSLIYSNEVRNRADKYSYSIKEWLEIIFKHNN